MSERELTVAERRRTAEKDAECYGACQQMLSVLDYHAARLQLPYANGVAWRISDAKRSIERLMEELQASTEAVDPLGEYDAPSAIDLSNERVRIAE
jgi:hypothetical protein